MAQDSRDSFHKYSGAVGEDFCGSCGNRGGRKANVDNCICARVVGFFDHAVEGFLAGFLQQFGVAFNFPAHEVFEPGENIFANIFSPHGAALNNAKVANNLLTGYAFESGQNHRIGRTFKGKMTQEVKPSRIVFARFGGDRPLQRFFSRLHPPRFSGTNPDHHDRMSSIGRPSPETKSKNAPL